MVAGMTARPCHEAFIYDGTDEFVRGIAAFARDAQRANEPIMIMVCGTKLAMLREELGADDVGVRFADIGSVGTNPARLIPMWLDFIAAARGRPSRGVGEPIWPERRGAELVEAQHHEALVNHALDPADPVWLVCPYDAGALDDTVVA